jgi:acyl dehydratase
MSALESNGPPPMPVALAEGDELCVRIGPLSRTDLIRYAAASGDHQGVFGAGLLHGGLLGLHLARWVGPESLRSLAVRVAEPVRAGDELTIGGRVERIEAEPDGVRVAHLELAVSRSDGAVVLRASAVAVVSVLA